MTGYSDRGRLAELWRVETDTFRAARPRSERLWREATPHLPDGVPMLWMAKWPGPWPVYVERAQGAHFDCVDGIDHVDLCLGDTGAMCGHAPAASVRAISEQLAKGSTFMLPTADAAAAAELLDRALRGAQLAIHALGDGREPQPHPLRPPGDRAPEDRRARLLLSRLGRRGLRDAGRRRRRDRAAWQHRRPGAAVRNDRGRAVQRRSPLSKRRWRAERSPPC